MQCVLRSGSSSVERPRQPDVLGVVAVVCLQWYYKKVVLCLSRGHPAR